MDKQTVIERLIFQTRDLFDAYAQDAASQGDLRAVQHLLNTSDRICSALRTTDRRFPVRK